MGMGQTSCGTHLFPTPSAMMEFEDVPPHNAVVSATTVDWTIKKEAALPFLALSI